MKTILEKYGVRVWNSTNLSE